MAVIEIFRVGRHVAGDGVSRDFSKALLERTAAVYSSERHPAPLVLGHPKNDAPAYGFASKLALVGEKFFAEVEHVAPAIKEAVRAKRYRYISAAFYLPESAGNPIPGALYLKHIGLLGAHKPAVRGMAEPEFAESRGCVEFAAQDSARQLLSITEEICFSAPAGYTADRQGLALYHRALAWSHAVHEMTFLDAIRLLS